MVRSDRQVIHDDISAIIQILARYLGQHLQACDTLPGIERWWLGPDVKVRRGDLAQALHWLHEQGHVLRRTAADGRVSYGRADHSAGLEARVLAQLADIGAPQSPQPPIQR